jgi:hypothetical protein
MPLLRRKLGLLRGREHSKGLWHIKLAIFVQVCSPCLNFFRENLDLFHPPHNTPDTQNSAKVCVQLGIMTQILSGENNGTYCRHFFAAFLSFYTFQSLVDEKNQERF